MKAKLKQESESVKYFQLVSDVRCCFVVWQNDMQNSKNTQIQGSAPASDHPIESIWRLLSMGGAHGIYIVLKWILNG